ncbi:MAG: hypothetical protein ACXV8R_12895 [Acidimicrobiia bacterium]
MAQRQGGLAMWVRRLVIAGLGAAVAIPLFTAPAGASTIGTAATTTTTAAVTATCSQTPSPTPPSDRGFTVVVTVPTQVQEGATADIHASVSFEVAPQATAGAISVTTHQSGTDAQQLIGVGGGSPNIEGTAPFPVTGAAGTEIAWTIDFFGETLISGGSSVSLICRPTAPIVIPATKIVGSPTMSHHHCWLRCEHWCRDHQYPQPGGIWVGIAAFLLARRS